MRPKFPVTLHKTLQRGVTAYQLKWTEGGVGREQSFASEAEAVMEMDMIEARLRVSPAKAGPGLAVRPPQVHAPLVSPTDVSFAALKLQAQGLELRESIEDYVAAVGTLKGTETSVRSAAAAVVELNHVLQPYDMSLYEAVFEWLELKKQIGDRSLHEVVAEYLRMTGESDGARSGGND